MRQSWRRWSWKGKQEMNSRSRVVCSLLCLAWTVSASTSSLAGDDLVVNLGRGPVTIHVPPSYEPGVPTPLVLLLHGYCSTGSAQEAYMQFTPLADEHGFLYAHPDGLTDIIGCQYWNGTELLEHLKTEPEKEEPENKNSDPKTTHTSSIPPEADSSSEQ